MTKFREIFKKRHVVLPVIHSDNYEQTIDNVEIAIKAKVDGVFLINDSMGPAALITLYKKVREKFPDLWIGLNLLGMNPVDVFKAVSNDVNGIWTDNAMIDENSETQDDAEDVLIMQKKVGFEGLYFGGFAFKYQRKVVNLELGAEKATKYMDVVTTSGAGTGKSAEIEKIQRIRSAIGDFPLAIASGITPENVRNYLLYTDCFLVATGISSNWNNLDENKVRELMNQVNNFKD